jgi:ABC-type transport system substrate-binding protein
MIKSGSSAESYALTTNTIWHPELKKKKVRQAMVHAINCAEMVEFLYSGYTTCRGNIIWPGIIGASERNTAPYKFDPELARQLLKEANYNPENKMTIVSRGTRIPKQLEVAESLQAFWINVGINVDFRVVEPSIRSALTKCGVGKAVQEILEAAGKDPKVDKPTNADFQAALDKGGADCPTGDLIGNQPSNETLDFGRQVRYYMNCFAIRSLICDPSSGGIQDQIAPALSASGDERQRLLEALADRFHDDVLFIPLFDLPVFYAVNPKLNWEPRLDPNVRVSTMWFSK